MHQVIHEIGCRKDIQLVKVVYKGMFQVFTVEMISVQ